MRKEKITMHSWKNVWIKKEFNDEEIVVVTSLLIYIGQSVSYLTFIHSFLTSTNISLQTLKHFCMQILEKFENNVTSCSVEKINQFDV